MNGFISFSINYLSYTPAAFPHSNRENADLLGVFWSDYDSKGVRCDCAVSCYTCGRSVVYYQTYSTTKNGEDVNYLQVLNITSAIGQKYIAGFIQATWVMVVTWSQMVPFPYTYNQNSTEVCLFVKITM